MSREVGLNEQLGLYLRTIRHLSPAQVVWRVRLRAQRQILASPLGGRIRARTGRGAVPPGAGWPAGFRPLDRLRFDDTQFNADFTDGRITLLSSSAALSDGWCQLDRPQLWRFHLHYWDWAWHLRASLDEVAFRSVFAEHYRAWKRENPWGRGDAWSPYVVSLRLWTLCGLHSALRADEALAREVADDISENADFLRWHCEYDVGGNHLLKNLKALIGAAVFLRDDVLLRRMRKAIHRQIDVQVLADGGHYERSPAYHAQVLGDLVDVEDLLGRAGLEPPVGLQPAIARMRSWLHAMAGPHRFAPAFNDGPCVGADELNLLGVHAGPHERLRWLAKSGYVVVNPSDRVHLVMDVGDPCPDELPAHAHADCLSFTLSVDGRPAVVDTGTSEYGAGERRQYERSTAAHNTVEVDGQNQTEVWGAFRAAGRARPRVLEVSVEGDMVMIDAEHTGYVRLDGRPVHRRRLTVSPSEIVVIDSIRGRGAHTSVSTLHIAERTAAVLHLGDDRVEAAEIEVSAQRQMEEVDGTHATAFGEHLPCRRLQQRCGGPLPHELSWRLSWPASVAPVPAAAERCDP